MKNCTFSFTLCKKWYNPLLFFSFSLFLSSGKRMRDKRKRSVQKVIFCDLSIKCCTLYGLRLVNKAIFFLTSYSCSLGWFLSYWNSQIDRKKMVSKSIKKYNNILAFITKFFVYKKMSDITIKVSISKKTAIRVFE